MKIKRSKLSKALYGLFFGKRKRSRRTKSHSKTGANQTSVEKPKQSTNTLKRLEDTELLSQGNKPKQSPNTPTKTKPKYDLSHLHEQVSATEYITNLRLGRSWIFPKLVKMGFVKKGDQTYEFEIAMFMVSFHRQYDSTVQNRRNVWSLMKRNYAAIAHSDVKDVHAKWWTKELFLEMMKWEFAVTNHKTRGLNVEEYHKIISNAEGLNDYDQISTTIDWYDVNRMRSCEVRCVSLPECFINAYLADGAYNSMMTMVKVYNLRLRNEAGESLSRDETIAEIENQANQLNGRKLLAYCKAKFFDSGIFDYERYR